MLELLGRINMKKFFIILLCIFCFGGCSNNSSNDSKELINYVEAKEKIINDGAILLDVRTEEEYEESHIDGAVLLSLDKISEDTVSEVVDRKDRPIIVYCRSGNRSQQAQEILNRLGYTKIYDLGAMSNWKE